MNLIIDIGNTRIKAALFENGEMVAQCTDDTFSVGAVMRMAAGRRIDRAIVSSTRGDATDVAAALHEVTAKVLLFDNSTPVPVSNKYLTPATLGRDRLAAAVGIASLYPGRNVMIVDFGTAITVDMVSADGEFLGGVISPGVTMRFKALNHYTASLPLLEPCECDGTIGRSTREAIELGVMNSVQFEIEGYISRMERKFDKMLVIFIGGEAKNFAKRIRNTIFASCNPVFYGLDRILEYNVSEEDHK